ncbi:MAG TPA: peptide chain release factor N(5)-glutamine methyltransferase [Gemmatimonadales bacterium]|nr:peptide chain release factor N(5)-glutamine methyltransferase [Gemmatimonadales bacterium]
MPDTVAVHRTLAEQLAAAAVVLERGGAVGKGRREAAALWAVLAGISPGDVWLRRDQPPPPELIEPFQRAVERRAAGAPFAYAVERIAFRTLELRIDPRALIPRPETEGLVELALQVASGGPGGAAADIGTGSGCIALSLAVEGAFDRVIAVEQSPAAAALARENVARTRPRTPVEIREGDLLEPLGAERFRVIVANPPYLTVAEHAALDAAVRDFEPREALVSGPDGLDATRALLARAATHLEPGGVLALEIDERRADAVCALAETAGWDRAVTRDDLFGRARYALVFPREGA